MKKSLTWEQRNIVFHELGHALVKAVPGSGKTATLVKRVERLSRSGVDHRSILILMYNKSAQQSFQRKLKKVLNSKVVPEVRTFHSLALKIVSHGEREGIIKERDLLTPEDDRYVQLVREAYRHGFNSDENYIDSSDIEELELFITRCRAAAVSPADAETDPTFSEVKPEFVRAYSRYCDLLEENNLRTFDDYLIEACSLLRKNPALCTYFKHIIVDEYQDVNLIQHDLIRALATPTTSVMAVGDINQCIYEWRGARPDFIGGLFEQHFKNTKVFHLSCTFRFGHELSLMANSVIRRNSPKLDKLCVSHPSTPNTNVKVQFDDCLSKVLPQLPVDSGTKAILSRTKANLAEAEIALRLCGLPYSYLNGGSSLHSRAEVATLVVGMSLCVHGDLRSLDDHSAKRALLYGFLRSGGFKWNRGQLKTAMEKMLAAKTDLLSVLGTVLESHGHQKNRFEELLAIRHINNETTPAYVVFQRLRQSGFLEGIGTEGVSRTSSNDQQCGVVRIEELLESSQIDARMFLKLILYPVQSSAEHEPFVLSTLHGSKGLEWDNVVIIGLYDTDFPGGDSENGSKLISQAAVEESIAKEDLEEQRRLFYVGITRARKQLNLLVPSDKRLAKWIDNAWDSTPKGTATATRFVYEAGWTACARTSKAIYNNLVEKQKSDFSNFHHWYLRDLQRLKV